MRIAVGREMAPGEARVALVPDLVGKLRAAGYEVAVQAGAGAGALLSDAAYEAAGALVTEHPFDEADLVLSVQPLDAECLAPLPSELPQSRSFAGWAPGRHRRPPRSEDHNLRDGVRAADFRAQSMDALSSQAMVVGYRGAIVAAEMLGQFFPLSMTAGYGATGPGRCTRCWRRGLQAIATCRRLGAVVKGYDVRAAAAEEIRSMGAQAIELPLPTLEGAGGYAREMTEDRAQRQRELLAGYVAAADALITTAAVPGRRAPLLVTTEMILQMAPGSVVVDLAAESGGNVEGVVAGSVVRVGPVQLWVVRMYPARCPHRPAGSTPRTC